MASSTWEGARRLGAALLLTATAIAPVRASVELDLCASFNTASMDRNVSIYQTNGLCSDFCRSDYAWSVTQDEGCWCSNFTPSKSSQVDLAKCNINCPAYPDEKCGGRGGLYGYVELKLQLPEGTKGPDSATTSGEVSSTAESSTTTKASSQPSSDSSTKDDPSSTSLVQTLTTDGTVKTVTVVPTGADDAEDGGSDEGGGGGLGTGPIVGIVVGVVGAFLIAGGAALFWFFKRRKRNQEDYQDDPSARGNSSDRMGSGRPEMSMGGGVSPNSGMGSSNRNSALAIDPRMDPFKQGLYMRNNGSQESIGTLRDDHDYSRRIQQPKVLRATNPDPDNDN